LSKQNFLAEYITYISLGVEIAGALAIPILIGYWLDSYFDLAPWLLLTGCLVGIINIFVMIFKLNKRFNDKS
jgi:F0F1-type ATP synthase assembly protein I